MTLAFGILGLLTISYAIWQKNEKRQDILFIIGGTLLLLYSISIDNWIFITLQSIFILSAVLELLKLKK